MEKGNVYFMTVLPECPPSAFTELKSLLTPSVTFLAQLCTFVKVGERLLIVLPSGFTFLGFSAYTLKKPVCVRSGDRGGHSVEPLLPITLQ